MRKTKNELALLKDIHAFLGYLGDKQWPLTQTGNLKLKDIWAVNDLLIKPVDLERRVGNMVNKVRTEWEARYIHFIRILCQVARLTKIRYNKISITANAKKFLRQSSSDQLAFLFKIWSHEINWDYFALTTTGIAEKIQRQLFNIFFLLQGSKGLIISIEGFAQTLLDNMPEISREDDHLEWEIKRIISYLEHFGAVEVKREEDKYFSKTLSFTVTDLGQELMQNLLREFGVETDLSVRAQKLLQSYSPN